MEQLLICLSTALIAGLLMSRLAKAVHLPAVTSYLLPGHPLQPEHSEIPRHHPAASGRCGADRRRGDHPRGPHQRPHRQQARSSGVPRLSFPHTIKRHSEALRSAFSFVLYFRMTSPFSASTVRLPPAFRVPSMMRSAAGSSTALRMTRRRSRAPNLPP